MEKIKRRAKNEAPARMYAPDVNRVHKWSGWRRRFFPFFSLSPFFFFFFMEFLLLCTVCQRIQEHSQCGIFKNWKHLYLLTGWKMKWVKILARILYTIVDNDFTCEMFWNSLKFDCNKMTQVLWWTFPSIFHACI